MQAVIYRKLSELVDRFQTERSTKRDVWVRRLFESLDWGSRPTFTIETDKNYGYRLLVDAFPFINVVTESPNNVDKVYDALNRAYNQDVSWVVATDFRSLGVYGSYWVSFPYDVSSALAMKIDHTDFLAEAHNLELLTPKEVGHNALNELYDNPSFTGRKQRRPIDIHLVERMAQWRQLGLESLDQSFPDVDALIHRLINTFILIRYLEDINSLPSNPKLLDIANQTDEEIFANQLLAVFATIRQRTGYSVPSRSDLNNLKLTPMRNLIRQLYGYPDWGVIYNFAAMNVDVLGRFYEEYLRMDVKPIQAKRSVLSLFEQSYELKDVRRQKGIYYTPRYVVDYILNSVIDRFKETHSSGELPVILDIAAGSGTFLSAAVDHLVRRYPKVKKHPAQLIDCLIGIDADSRATEASKLNLTVKCIAQGVEEPLTPLKVETINVIFGGARQKMLTQLLPHNGVDIVVGNPPYISYETLSKEYDVSTFPAIFETAQGRVDSYILFVETALKLLRDGGFGGLVLPTSILRTQTSGFLRDWLAQRADVLEIIDFQDQPVFQFVSAYICLLIFRKRSKDATSPKVTVAKVYEISDTPSTQLASVSIAAQGLNDGSEVFRIDQPKGKGPWDLRNQTEVQILSRIRDAADCTVDDVLQLRQGVKTGADDIFIVEATPLDANLYVVHSNVLPNKVERDLMIPVFRNRDLKRWGACPNAFLIYPYDRDNQQLINWDVLKNRYPGASAYLAAKESNLSKRKSLRGKLWYELIEPRLQTVLSNSPRLFISELSLRPLVCRSKLTDVAIVGNASLMLKDESYDLDVIMAYLNSIVAEWFLRQVSPLLHGGYILLRQNNLSRLPLPIFLKDPDSFVYSELKKLSSHLSDRIGKTTGAIDPQTRREVEAKEEQINSLIIEALKLSASQADHIRRTISFARGAK